MDIQSYTLEDLESHLSLSTANSNAVWPLSPLRVSSYVNNPRAEKTDCVLFELRMEEKLVAYRTLLPDCYFDLDGKPHPFAWLSGNWVDPSFRRQGLSTKLLQQAEAHWEGRLMYTNYAPASKAVYDRTGQFPLLTRREGRRFYLRAANEELLGERLGSKKLLRTGDQLINTLRKSRLQKFPHVDPDQCKVELLTGLDTRLALRISQWQEQSLFRRGETEFSWVLNNPWVTSKKVAPLNYHFSYGSDRFENILVKFSLPDQSIGLAWLVLHNQSLSIPYLFVENEEIYPFMATEVIHRMVTQGCSYATVRSPLLVQYLMKHQNVFLTTRNLPQQIFAHKLISAQIPQNKTIHDGDGDVVFTG